MCSKENPTLGGLEVKPTTQTQNVKEKALEYIAVANWVSWAVQEKHPLVKEGVEFKVVFNLGKVKVKSEAWIYNDYVGWSEGSKWIHILYRNVHMYSVGKGKAYGYYVKIRKDKYSEILKQLGGV